MSSSKLSDIDEILAKSQRLMTQASTGSSSSFVAGAAPYSTGFGFTNVGQPNNFRAVSELEEVSKQWRSAIGKSAAPSSIDALRILSNREYDAKKAFDEVNSINIKTADDSSMQFEGTDIEGYLAHHHDMIILAAIEEARTGAEEHVQEMQRRWAANEWSNARSQFMESLGHRAYKWEGLDGRGAVNAASRGSSTGGSGLPGFTPQTDLNRQRQQFGMCSPTKGQSETPLKLLANEAMTSTPSAASLGAMTLRNEAFRKPPLSGMLLAQSNFIREMNSFSHASNAAVNDDSVMSRQSISAVSTAATRPYLALASAIRIPGSEMIAAGASVTDGLTKSDLNAYKGHLQMLAYMVGESGADAQSSQRATSIAPGFFSAICFDNKDLDPQNVTENRKQLLTRGACAYFEMQIWEVWSQILDNSVEQHGWTVIQSESNISRKQRLKSYVSMLWHYGHLPRSCGLAMCCKVPAVADAPSIGFGGSIDAMSPISPRARRHDVLGTNSRQQLQSSQRGSVTPLWAFIYHCLRTGEISDAAEEVNASIAQGHSDDGERAAYDLLQNIATMMTNEESVSGRRSSAADSRQVVSESQWNRLREAVLECRAQFERELGLEEQRFDPYRAMVFNLLGLVDREMLASTGIPGFSIEDFLWAHLWFIQRMRSLNKLFANRSFVSGITNSSGGSTTVSRIDKCREVDLFELVLEYGGEEYFDQDRTTPFRYAMVLCCCQRFGDAISHLWNCSKVLPAVQLTAVALHYGLVLPHMPLCCNPSHPMLMGRRFLAGGTVGLAQEPTPVSVLLSFVTSPNLQRHPSICTDYLVSLDSFWLQQCQGLLGEMRDSHKAKSQNAVSAAIESFILSLDRQELAEVVGIPIDDQTDSSIETPSALGTGLRGSPRTKGGRLEYYMSSHQIDLLLSRAAFRMVTERGEAEAAIYLYLLAGRYNDVLEELCMQLCNTIVPTKFLSKFGVVTPSKAVAMDSSSSDRAYWRSISESFISRYLTQTSSSSSVEVKTSQVYFALAQNGTLETLDALKLLTNLFDFVDVAVELSLGGTKAGVDASSALNFLDQLNILPVHPDQVNDYSLILSAFCRPVLDDVLIMAADLTSKAYDTLKSERAVGSAGPGATMVNLTTDKDIRMRALKDRMKGLSAFAHKLKSRLNRQETPGIIARIESSLI